MHLVLYAYPGLVLPAEGIQFITLFMGRLGLDIGKVMGKEDMFYVSSSLSFLCAQLQSITADTIDICCCCSLVQKTGNYDISNILDKDS